MLTLPATLAVASAAISLLRLSLRRLDTSFDMVAVLVRLVALLGHLDILGLAGLCFPSGFAGRHLSRGRVGGGGV